MLLLLPMFCRWLKNGRFYLDLIVQFQLTDRFLSMAVSLQSATSKCILHTYEFDYITEDYSLLKNLCSFHNIGNTA
jgi:hypothetical protein